MSTSTDRGERGVLEQRAVSQVGLQRGEHSKQISIKILIKKIRATYSIFHPFLSVMVENVKIQVGSGLSEASFLTGNVHPRQLLKIH